MYVPVPKIPGKSHCDLLKQNYNIHVPEYWLVITMCHVCLTVKVLYAEGREFGLKPITGPEGMSYQSRDE